MNERMLSELLQYSDDHTILIVNGRGRLEELICPFTVKAITNVGTIKKGDIQLVESIKITIRIITVYVIKGKAYYYFHFEILPLAT